MSHRDKTLPILAIEWENRVFDKVFETLIDNFAWFFDSRGGCEKAPL